MSQDTRKWTLEIGGQRKGPMSVKEIHHLLKQGGVYPATRVYCTEPGVLPTTVQELTHIHSTENKPPLPPTPKRQNLAAAHDDYASDDEDPLTDLFNTLQAAKLKAQPKNQPTQSLYLQTHTRVQPTKVLGSRWYGSEDKEIGWVDFWVVPL